MQQLVEPDVVQKGEDYKLRIQRKHCLAFLVEVAELPASACRIWEASLHAGAAVMLSDKDKCVPVCWTGFAEAFLWHQALDGEPAEPQCSMIGQGL